MDALSKSGALLPPISGVGEEEHLRRQTTDPVLSLFLTSYIHDLERGQAKPLDRAIADANLMEIISIDKLGELIQSAGFDYTTLAESVELLIDGAEAILEMHAAEPFSIGGCINESLDKLLNICISTFEGILATFGIAEVFQPADDDLQAQWKGSKVVMLISLAAFIISILVPIIGPSLASIIVGGAFLSIMTMSLIYPLFKGLPNQISKGQNWTQLIRDHQMPSPTGRKEIVDQIVQVLTESSKVKHHPMILGKSGVGKTETLKAFAQAVERGDYPELKGKTVYYFNMADLVASKDTLSSGNTILSRISKAIGKHRDDAIIIFDEIHMACQKDPTMADQLKTMLDSGQSGFPHVIGVTTEEEYYRDIFREHSAFARRFTRIGMNPLDDAEVLQILTNICKKDFPSILLEEGILQYVYDQSRKHFPDKPEPLSSLTILYQALGKTTKFQQSKTEIEIEELKKEIRALRISNISGFGTAFIPYGKKDSIDGIKAVRRDLETLIDKAQTEKTEIEAFYKLRDQLWNTQMAAIQSALRISHYVQGKLNPSQERESFAFLLMSHFVIPMLTDKLKKAAEKLGINAEINKELIDLVIEEELAMEAKAKAAIKSGQADIKSRKMDDTDVAGEKHRKLKRGYHRVKITV